MKRLLCIPVISLVILFLTFNPVLAEERTVLGLNLPLTTAICYEKESAYNRSWIISGLFYTDGSFSNYDVTLSCYSGMRFYNGNAAGRCYAGLYGSGLMVYLEPNRLKVAPGIMGVLGYEYRFGPDKNARIFVERGLAASWKNFEDFLYGPAFEAGIGLNINQE